MALATKTFPVRNEHGASDTAGAIRIGLARKNSTQSALAERLRLSQPAIHRRMTGKVAWRVSELMEVADYLGVPVADLLIDDEKASA